MQEYSDIEIVDAPLTQEHIKFMDELYRKALKEGLIPPVLMGVLAHMIGHLIGLSKIPEECRGMVLSMLLGDIIGGCKAHDKVEAKNNEYRGTLN